MRFIAAQTDLARALQTVTRAANGRTSPVCGHVLLTALENELHLKCFDLELAIKTMFPAQATAIGSLLAPAELLTQIIASLPSDAPVTLSSADEGHGFTVDTPSATISLQGLDPGDFPDIPSAGSAAVVDLPAVALAGAIAATIEASSDDASKQQLCGVNLHLTGEIVAAATNGHRLATVTIPLPELVRDMPQQATIPSRALKEIARLLHGAEDCSLVIGTAHMACTVGDTVVTSRIMDGTYPNYRQLIPQKFANVVTVNRRDAIAAIKRVALIAGQSNNVVSVKDDTFGGLEITASNDVGSASDHIAADAVGSFDAAFNAGYLLDGLATFKSERVILKSNTPTTPVVMVPDSDEQQLYLVMPVMTSLAQRVGKA